MSNRYDGYGWIKVKKYKMDETLSWEERYRQLEEHHIEEANFLIEEVRKLAKRPEALPGQINAARAQLLPSDGVPGCFLEIHADGKVEALSPYSTERRIVAEGKVSNLQELIEFINDHQDY